MLLWWALRPSYTGEPTRSVEDEDDDEDEDELALTASRSSRSS
jgi:hypothetical protein